MLPFVLSYPGIPDMGYETLVKAYGEMTAPKPGVKARTSPEIEEILVSGDLQVWRRESAGTWKFARGMHFRIPEEKPQEAPAAPGAGER